MQDIAHVYPQSTERTCPARALGKEAELEEIGINIPCPPPGLRSSWTHAEENEEEFFYVIAGEVDDWIDGDVYPMRPGDLVAFPAGTGISHSFVNDSGDEVFLLVGG